MNAPKVRRIFELFAYHGCTLDMLIERLAAEGIVYRDAMPRFPRSTLHAILMIGPTSAKWSTRGNGIRQAFPACGPRDLGTGPGACWAGRSTGPMS